VDVLSTADFFKYSSAQHSLSTTAVQAINKQAQEAEKYAKLCMQNLEKEVFRNEGSEKILDYGKTLRFEVINWLGPSLASANITLYTYNYGSSIRTLVVVKEEIVDSSPYWVERLPFVRRARGSDGGLHIMPPNVEMQFRDSTEATSVLVTHDNHFGHFIGDTLGLLYLLDRIGMGNVLMPEPMPSIKALIQTTLPNLKIRYLPVPPVGNLLAISHLECMLPSSIPFFLSIYLGRTLFKSMVNNTRLSGRLLLHRKGLSKSRIVNFPELAGELIHEGFELITAEAAPLHELAEKLSGASIIATEVGSCHLNGILMADQNAKIIWGLPYECITEPTTSMIISGWPYIFAHPGIVLFPSIASEEDLSMSKDPMVNKKCRYDYEKLGELGKCISFDRFI